MFKMCLLLATLLTPVVLSAQNISLSKLLSLQKSPIINIQDYIETSAWKLKGIITLKEVDSIIFQNQTRLFLDSLARYRKPEGNPLTANHYYGQLVENTRSDAPAWIEYLSRIDTRINSTTLFTNSLTITLPKFYIFHAINLKLPNFDRHTFNHSLRFSFGDEDTFKSLIRDIGLLQIPEKDQYVMYNKPLITRIYKLADQVINLTIFNTSTQSYSLEVYSRSDYDYLHAAEQELKGKSDFIH
jgi:hypothetical protein